MIDKINSNIVKVIHHDRDFERSTFSITSGSGNTYFLTNGSCPCKAHVKCHHYYSALIYHYMANGYSVNILNSHKETDNKLICIRENLYVEFYLRNSLTIL
jgi:hypothetical protein